MAEDPNAGMETKPAEKRAKRLALPRPKRQSAQSSPVVLVLALVGGVLLVVGALFGGMALNRGSPDTGSKKPSVPVKETKETPAPTEADKQ